MRFASSPRGLKVTPSARRRVPPGTSKQVSVFDESALRGRRCWGKLVVRAFKTCHSVEGRYEIAKQEGAYVHAYDRSSGSC